MSYKMIVCGVTGSDHGQKAAQEASRLAKENQAGLIFVYAVDTTFLKGITIQLTSEFAQTRPWNIWEAISWITPRRSPWPRE